MIHPMAGPTPLAAADRELGDRLVAAGRLSMMQLDALLKEQAARGGPERVRLATLLQEKRLFSSSDGQMIRSSDGLPPPAAAAAPVPKRVGPYEIVKELGRGA